MNLLLWRHAEAENLPDTKRNDRALDLQRALTERGHQQADKAARWLDRHAPKSLTVLCSPALRSQQTAFAYDDRARVIAGLAPDVDVSTVLAAIYWPHGRDKMIVGHQPWIGRLASLLLAGEEMDWHLRKGGLWWLKLRSRENESRIVLRTALSPDLL